MQRKIGDFHKDFYIKQIEKLAYHRNYFKILGRHHVADVRHKTFESTSGDISIKSYYVKRCSFEPGGQLKNELFDKQLYLIHGRLLFRLLQKNSQYNQFL